MEKFTYPVAEMSWVVSLNWQRLPDELTTLYYLIIYLLVPQLHIGLKICYTHMVYCSRAVLPFAAINLVLGFSVGGFVSSQR